MTEEFLKTPEQKKIEIALDATMLDTFVSCPAKFNYRFNLNKQSPEKAAPLDRGSLLHKGLEPYFKALQQKKSFEEALSCGIQGFDLTATESDLEPEKIRFYRATLIENINYWRHKDAYFEILAVESPFAYELYSDTYMRITMIGVIDLLVNEGRYERLPYDHKSYERDYPVRRKTNQFCNYVNALKSNYLIVNRIGLQTSYPPEKKHKRVPLSYDELFLEQWVNNTIKWIKSYVECAVENDWPLNDTSCDKYNRLCEYYDICDTSGVEGKIYKLNANFRDADRWDVAKSLGLDK